MIDSREELMISPSGDGRPTLRLAHFIKPSVASTEESSSQLSSLSFSSLPSKFEPQKLPSSVSFSGWRVPVEKWKAWVQKMASSHENTWKKAGIYEAVMNSTYKIIKNPHLVIGVAEKWFPETKSFVFPWGEATITLEDLMVLSGYSVLGSPVFESLLSEELKGIESELIRARKSLLRTTAKKAVQNLWMEKFKDSCSEIEHEAFLAYWLCRFVFPSSFDVVNDRIFPMAIHLARGTRLALAPAVLAGIYRDLSLLKRKIAPLTMLEADGVNKDNDNALAIAILSPFQLVQLWVWERFPVLQPKPNLIKNGEPRFARWDSLRSRTHKVRLVLDSAKESFNWRPYAITVENLNLPGFYREKEMWMSLDSGLDEELLSFVQCLKVSKLVGLDCIEQYLPHRVAMQFGLDQDIPGYAARSNETSEVAWHYYTRTDAGMKCYIPSRLFEADVTTRYSNWWKGSVLILQGTSKGDFQQKNSSIDLNGTLKSLKEKKRNEKHNGCNFASRFKITQKIPKAKKAAMKFTGCKASSKSTQGIDKGGTASSFKIKPKVLKTATIPELFRSSFSIMQKTSKENREADGASVNPAFAKNGSKTSSQTQQPKENNSYCSVTSGVPVADASATPGLSLKSLKESAESLKRKREEKDATLPYKGAFVANVSRSRKPDQRLRYESEDFEVASPNYPASFAAIKEMINAQVPPGFPPKCNKAEAIDSVEEDQLTIAEWLKTVDRHGSNDKRQCHYCKNFSSQNQNHPFSIADIEVGKTSGKAISMEEIVQDAAIENQQGGEADNASDRCGNHSSSVADNEAVEVLDAVIILKKEDKHSESAWKRQTCNSENASAQLSHCHSPLSLIGGNKAFGNSESLTMSSEKIFQEVVLTEASRGVKEEGVEYANGSTASKGRSINGNEGGSSSDSIEKPWLKLEALLGRLEKIAAERWPSNQGMNGQSSFKHHNALVLN